MGTRERMVVFGWLMVYWVVAGRCERSNDAAKGACGLMMCMKACRADVEECDGRRCDVKKENRDHRECVKKKVWERAKCVECGSVCWTSVWMVW